MARVLIDDDEEVRLLERHILEAGGHELYFAKNGEEAMRLFMRKSPDVVITDLQMPRGNGLELIEALLQRADHRAVGEGPSGSQHSKVDGCDDDARETHQPAHAPGCGGGDAFSPRTAVD